MGTHAYIISAQQAERMALTAEYMIQRSRLPVDDSTRPLGSWMERTLR